MRSRLAMIGLQVARLRDDPVLRLILRAATGALPLLSMAYLVRVLGADHYGRLVFSQALISGLSLLVDYGFDSSATARVAQLRLQSSHELARFASTVMCAKVLLAGAAFLTLCLLLWVVPPLAAQRPLFFAAFLHVVGSMLLPLWLYRGHKATHLLSAVLFCGQALSLAALLVFVRDPGDLLVAVVIESVALPVTAILSLIALPQLMEFRFIGPDWPTLKGTLTDGWRTFLTESARTAGPSATLVVLGVCVPFAVVGYYGATSKLVLAAAALVLPISQALYPRTLTLMAVSRERALEYMARLFWRQGGAMLMLSLSLYLCAPLLVHVLLGLSFDDCIPLLRLLASLPFIVAVSNVLGSPLLQALQMDATHRRLSVRGGLFHLTIVTPLVLLAGATGSALAVVCVESAITVTMLLVLKKQARSHEPSHARQPEPGFI